jgi:hypothetical protein
MFPCVSGNWEQNLACLIFTDDAYCFGELISEIIGDVQCVTLLALKTPRSWTQCFRQLLYLHLVAFIYLL